MPANEGGRFVRLWKKRFSGAWVSFPHVRLIHLSANALGRFLDLLEEAGTSGNLSTDVLIALHCFEHSATIASNDRDFERFAGVKSINPLA